MSLSFSLFTEIKKSKMEKWKKRKKWHYARLSTLPVICGSVARCSIKSRRTCAHDDPACTHLHEEYKEAGQQFAALRYCRNIGRPSVYTREVKRNTYIYPRDSRPLANKRRLWREEREMRAFTFEIEARRAWKSKREKCRQLERKRGGSMIIFSRYNESYIPNTIHVNSIFFVTVPCCNSTVRVKPRIYKFDIVARRR